MTRWTTFEAHRPHLHAVATRLLGSRAEADDAAAGGVDPDERADPGAVENLAAWLTTVVSRVCLTMLDARRRRREEPLEGGGCRTRRHRGPDGPTRAEALVADAVGAALLVVLETLQPAERLAFVLHDLFAVPFEDVAMIVDRTPTAARQLASPGAAPRPGRGPPRVRPPIARVVDAFLAAAPRRRFEGPAGGARPRRRLRADEGGGALRIVQGARGGGEPAPASRGRRGWRTRRSSTARPASSRPRTACRSPCSRFTVADGRITAIDALRDRPGSPGSASRRSSGNALAESVRFCAVVEYVRVEPFEQPLSRLALGTLGFSAATRERDYALLDAWVEAGGNVIDTAHVYEDGEAERLLGSWLRDRPGMREQVVIVTKGAHPHAGRARVTPADIVADLRDSLERLGGPVDLYLLHRDDPAVGVDELIDALDARRQAGEIRAFGVSNWALASDRGGQRLRGRPRHHRHLLQQPAPLARDPGGAAVAGLRVRERRRLPSLARAHRDAVARLVGQAGGFFARSEGESSRVYQSAPNRERRKRAEELGARPVTRPTRSRSHGCSRSRSRCSRRSGRTARAPAREPGGARGDARTGRERLAQPRNVNANAGTEPMFRSDLDTRQCER